MKFNSIASLWKPERLKIVLNWFSRTSPPPVSKHDICRHVKSDGVDENVIIVTHKNRLEGGKEGGGGGGKETPMA